MINGNPSQKVGTTRFSQKVALEEIRRIGARS